MVFCYVVSINYKLSLQYQAHHTAYLMLKEAVTQAPILCYPDPTKQCVVYTDTWGNACGAQLSQEHSRMEFSIAFLSHIFMDTQRKWSTTKQEAHGMYYAVTKWNYYLQGAEVIVYNDYKSLARFLNGKNANNKVNRWELKFTTYNITFEWISEAQNKAADCLSRLLELWHDRQTIVQMLAVTDHDGLTFNTRRRTTHPNIMEDLTPQPKADTNTRYDHSSQTHQMPHQNH